MRKYKILDKLGEGSFANVHKCVQQQSQEIVAVKQLKQKFDNWEECKRLREVKSLTKLKHINIIKCTEVILERNKELYLVFEYAPSNLWQIITDPSVELNDSRIKLYFAQLLEGLSYMHTHNFFHRDIKPENLLIGAGDCLKIADFGLAREIRSRPPYTGYVSTRWYRAPELLLGNGFYTSQIDLWSAGVILGELCLRTNMFPGDSDIDMLHRICRSLGTFTKDTWPEGSRQLGQRQINLPKYESVPLPKWFERTPLEKDEKLGQLFLDLLCFDPQTRLSAQQALKSPFFSRDTTASVIKQKLVRQPSEIDIESVLDQIMSTKTSPKGKKKCLMSTDSLEFRDVEAFLEALTCEEDQKNAEPIDIDQALEELMAEHR